MGAGNPLIRSYDNDLYEPTTFFIDFTPSDEDVKESLISNDLDPEDESIWNNEVWFMQEEDYNSLCEYLVDACELHKPDKDSDDELSASFRGSARILAESDNILVVTCGEEYHHTSIGCVPNFKLEDLCEDMWQEHCHKEEWYEARNKSLAEKTDDLADKLYQKKLKVFKKEAVEVMEQIHKAWSSQMSMRNGAWMSLSIKTIGKTFFKDNI